MEGLKIIELRAENIKKLKAVSIRPDDNTVIISGKNRAGKSSVLDAIWYALGGSDATKGTIKPIREGESEALVKLDLGSLIVTRKWTANDTSYLTVENKDGAVFKFPQAMLNQMIGNLSFDPLAFTNMPAKDQKDTLIGLIDLGFDLDTWEEKRNKLYDDRTDINRKIKDTKGALSNMPEIPVSVPEEEISISGLYQEIKKAKDILEGNKIKRRQLLEKWHKIDALRREIESLMDKLTDLKEELEETTKEYWETKQTVDALVDPDIYPIEEKIAGAEEINKAIRLTKERRSVQNKLDNLQIKSEDLTKEIDILDRQKTEALQKAKFPIEGLGFDELGVTYNGIPFHQCSSAEQLRVSLAIAITLNPKLRVIRIMDGSLLDSAHMKIIQEMVKERDYQCWVERVKETPDGASVYIEDGTVVGESHAT